MDIKSKNKYKLKYAEIGFHWRFILLTITRNHHSQPWRTSEPLLMELECVTTLFIDLLEFFCDPKRAE